MEQVFFPIIGVALGVVLGVVMLIMLLVFVAAIGRMNDEN